MFTTYTLNYILLYALTNKTTLYCIRRKGARDEYFSAQITRETGHLWMKTLQYDHERKPPNYAGNWVKNSLKEACEAHCRL